MANVALKYIELFVYIFYLRIIFDPNPYHNAIDIKLPKTKPFPADVRDFSTK